MQNADLPTYSGQSNWKTGAENTLLQLEVIDDYNFKFTFADPNPLLLYKIVRPTPACYSPGHYMKQFHIELTEDVAALEAKAKEAGFETWAQYYEDRGRSYMNPERPSTGA